MLWRARCGGEGLGLTGTLWASERCSFDEFYMAMRLKPNTLAKKLFDMYDANGCALPALCVL
jgi:hypothetical protein